MRSRTQPLVSSATEQRAADGLGARQGDAGAVLRLPWAALEWLCDQGLIEPSSESPISRVLDPDAWSPLPRREEAAAQLARSGAVRAAARSTSIGTFELEGRLASALGILEQPVLSVRVGIAEPGPRTTVFQFFLARGLAVAGQLDAHGIELLPSMTVDDFRATLLRHLDSSLLPEGMQCFSMLRPLYWLTTAFWPERGKSASAVLTDEEIAELVGDREEAESLLASLAAAGVVRRRGTTRLAAAYRRWLEMMWSGHVFEVDFQPSVEAANAATADIEERLLFVGPPGRRLLCQEVDVPHLAGNALRREDRQLLVLSRLRPSEVSALLDRLLAPATTSAETSAATVPGELPENYLM